MVYRGDTQAQHTPLAHAPRTQAHKDLVSQAATVCDVTQDGGRLRNSGFISKV